MKRLKFLIPFIFCTIFVSCIGYVKPGVSFDEDEFNLQKAKWEELNIKNYSFEYTFGTGGIPFYTRGKVIVENGIGSVEFEDEESLNKESICFLEIKSIDEAFDAIYKSYLNSIEESKTNSSHISYNIKYDSEFGFPTSAYDCEETNEIEWRLYTGDSSTDFSLAIEEFEIIKSE